MPRRRKGDVGVDGDGTDFAERSGLPLAKLASANEAGDMRCESAERWSMLTKSVAGGKMAAVAAAIVRMVSKLRAK